MDTNSDHDLARRSSAAAEIMSRRAAFSAYNISRIRELIRFLPPRKYKLFQQIPFWLHINKPQVPGFVNNSRAAFGIYRFRESGFWKQSQLHPGPSEKDLRPFLPSHEYIQGLYLIGSSGTLAQTETSDFDYWVVVDGERMDPARKRLLNQKLHGIETYCRERCRQEVSFFVLDEAQVRGNQFDAMDEESSGSAQRTLLKEEFYRTFIMIAGRIPYWAVLAPGLDDGEYRRRIDAAVAGGHLRFIPEDYIDLGNLAAINRRESLGALLWQIYKARHSPVKSLIKATLIAHYFFSEEEFLCDTIKTRFFQGTHENLLVDPYVLMFEKGLAFFRDLEDRDGLDLLKKCIFLRVSGRKPLPAAPTGSPRQVLLMRYLRQWGWDEKTIARMARYRQWPEAEKLRFERAVFEKISFLYELILKAKEREGAVIDMTDRDLSILTNRIAGHFRQQPGKIPRCSSYVKRNASVLQFIVEGKSGKGGAAVWSVFGQDGLRGRHCGALLFEGPELLKTAAWLILNHIYKGKKSEVRFQAASSCEVTENQARRFVLGVFNFFKESMSALPQPDQPPSWTNLLVCLHRSGPCQEDGPVCADFLVMNTWGEFYFDVLPLDHSETETRAFYRIAEHIWIFAQGRAAFRLPWRMIQPGGSGAGRAEEIVAMYFEQFIKNALELRALRIELEKRQEGWPDNELLLDR